MNKRIILIISILGYLSLDLALNFLNNPSNGYEISIYQSVNILFWIFASFSLCIGLFVMVNGYFVKDNSWIIGLSLLIFGNLTILLLPYLKSYYIYGREDALTHIGHAVDITSSGHIYDFDIYPVQHILTTVLHYFSNIELSKISNFIAPYFTIIYIFYIFLLAKVTLCNRQKMILAVASSTVYILSPMKYNVVATSMGLSILMIPLIFYLYIKNNDFKFKFLLFLSVILYPFFHPLTALILVAGLLILNLGKNMKFDNKLSLNLLSSSILSLPSILFLTLVIWILNHFWFWRYSIHSLLDWFVGETKITMAGTISSSFDKLGLRFIDIIEIFIKMFGHNIIYLSITFVMIIYILFNRINQYNYLFILSGWIFLTSFLQFLHLFLTIAPFGAWRLVNLMMILTPLFVGYGLDKLSKKIKIKVFSFFIIFTILIISLFIAITSEYGSPYTRQPNEQVTYMEVSGVNWLILHKNPEILANYNRLIYRLTDALYGTNWERQHYLYPNEQTTSPIGPIPPHFNYTNFPTIGDSFEYDAYISITKYDMVFHDYIYKELNQFNEIDFEKIKNDLTINKLYSNGEYESWLVKGKRKKMMDLQYD